VCEPCTMLACWLFNMLTRKDHPITQPAMHQTRQVPRKAQQEQQLPVVVLKRCTRAFRPVCITGPPVSIRTALTSVHNPP
jgi:hypothetical protein